MRKERALEKDIHPSGQEGEGWGGGGRMGKKVKGGRRRVGGSEWVTGVTGATE